ncbi:transaldolase [Halopseudomonas phragmitis]|uniref:Transaldolase n=2 Tax=Pseudomonadaceae TaxID=135621 RepID=A0A1V0B642_9GAMM|nr:MULTISPECIES: transaldolase [Pseudomonadaceae]AQZ95361.1 transaldolase [Halopseudomonas phragmitis]RHW20116.1 transaldolase [Pseudomonas jilinensis]
MTSKLDSLKQHTIIVADTGDIQAIRALQPVDATTNPSLLLKAAEQPEYRALLDQALRQAAGSLDPISEACDRFAIALGSEIVKLVPGRVSTEVDARLSFDRDATIAKAHRLIEGYEELGITRDRVLIKIAATWEGIQAAAALEREGIQCNLTLLFSFAQAQACADAGVFLISPFVGRIYDWYKRQEGRDFSGLDDPGVQSVARIFRYYKEHLYATVVMGASFRNIGQIEALTGCDRLTISPALLQQLAGEPGELELSPALRGTADSRTVLDERAFRWSHNEDAMATEKLAEGIRAFAADQLKLERLLAARAASAA